MRFEPSAVENLNGRAVAVIFDRDRKRAVRCYRRGSRIVAFADDRPVPKGMSAAARKLLDRVAV